jgi:molecular chaperone GrpE
LTELDRDKKDVSPADTEGQEDVPRAKALQEHGDRSPVGIPGFGDEDASVQPAPEEDALEMALKEASDNRDRWVRAVAELENYKKRALQEKSRLLKYKNEELLRELLPIVDNMERALAHCDVEGRCDPLTEGVSMIGSMFRDLLGRFGVTPMTALGEAFDPHVHEALAKIPTPNQPPNTVVEVLEKGYTYQDRLLRPAKVAVSAAVTEAESGNE